jgi:hypothetical protein
MRRIAIVGPAGSGKSTLARRLGSELGIPVTHLDWLNWASDWSRAQRDEFEQAQREIVRGESWIVDGSFADSLPMRAERADTIIVLDCPIWLCLWRLIRRNNRPDQPANMPSFRPFRRLVGLLAITAAWPVLSRHQILRAATSATHGRIVSLRSDSDIERFVVAARSSTDAAS